MPKKSDLDYTNIARVVKENAALTKTKFLEQTRSKAITVSDIQKLETVKELMDSLEKAIKDGSTFKEWQASFDVESVQDKIKANLNTVYRNSTNTAYNQGTYQSALEVQDEFPYLMYEAINDSRTRESHARMNGIVRRVDDPFWSRNLPINGHNCRCGVRQLSEAEARAMGITTDRRLDRIKKEGGKPDREFNSPIKRNSVVGLEQAFQQKINELKSPVLRKQARQLSKKKSSDIAIWLKRFQNMLDS